MDAIASMASTIQRITAQQTPEERRRAKNRRYYERNRDRWAIYERIKTLRALARLLMQ